MPEFSREAEGISEDILDDYEDIGEVPSEIA